MLIYIPLDKSFSNRKELKKFLGGTNAYNKALKLNKIKFINYCNQYDKRRNKEYS